jgi:5'-3' exonuclease
MHVHLVDGTYELFRFHYGPNNRDPRHGATIGVLSSMLDLVRDGATHVGVATDHVIESFRNDLYEGYKDGSGIDPDLFAQFPEIEDALRAAGFAVFAMVDHEADDALASAAVAAAADPRVERAIICTPDKDLGQCVRADGRIVQYDRRKQLLIDRAAVIEKFGVAPESIADYLGLVGDTADGFPGLAGWGAKSSSVVLARYGHIEHIPGSADDWDVTVRGAAKLAATLAGHRDQAILFRTIATVITDLDLFESVDDLRWTGPTPAFAEVCAQLGAPQLVARAEQLTPAL